MDLEAQKGGDRGNELFIINNLVLKKVQNDDKLWNVSAEVKVGEQVV